MSNLQYRIKMVTKNNGQKKYTPEVGTPKLSIGKIIHIWVKYESIIDNRDSVNSSEYAYMNYDTKEEAV